MIKFKSRLTKAEKSNISCFINETEDPWGEFYQTRLRMRLYIRENLDLFFDSLKTGDKIAYNDMAIAIITGFSDKFNRHYIKFLVKDLKSADELLKSISWSLNIDVWCKLKKNNPLVEVLKANNFKYYASRGKEQLLVKQYKKGK